MAAWSPSVMARSLHIFSNYYYLFVFLFIYSRLKSVEYDDRANTKQIDEETLEVHMHICREKHQ